VEAEQEELVPNNRKVKEGIVETREGMLYRKGMLWIPNKKGLIDNFILESEHDTKVAGQMGQDKMMELIRRNFWWPGMNERVINFVRSL